MMILWAYRKGKPEVNVWDNSKKLKLTSGSLECTNIGQRERNISIPISECMFPCTHFPWQRQTLGKEGHLGSATISLIYICQHTDFSHCSLAQASIVVHIDTSILSHPKMNIPNVWIRNFFFLDSKSKNWGTLLLLLCLLLTKQHDDFSSRGTGLYHVITAQSPPRPSTVHREDTVILETPLSPEHRSRLTQCLEEQRRMGNGAVSYITL